jgi:uridylate kinase
MTGETRGSFKRIMLKLSGEVLQDKQSGQSLDARVLNSIACQIEEIHNMNVQIGIVVGGGNIFRGMPGEQAGIDRTTGDNMGMLATMINSLALQAAIETREIDTRVMSAIDMPKIAEPVIRRRAIRHLEKRRVVIFGAGTGNPYFTTDSAAALRASEIRADLLLKATKVDGIYSDDPVTNPDAELYREVTYSEALQRRLRIMDAAAFSLCQENSIPIIVFNFFKENEMVRIVQGEPVGTLVKD